MSSIVRLIRKAIKAKKSSNDKRWQALLERAMCIDRSDLKKLNDFFNRHEISRIDDPLIDFIITNYMAHWRLYRRDKRKHHRTMFMDFYDDSKQVVFKYNKTWHYPKKTIFWDILSTADGMLYNQPIDPPEA